MELLRRQTLVQQPNGNADRVKGMLGIDSPREPQSSFKIENVKTERTCCRPEIWELSPEGWVGGRCLLFKHRMAGTNHAILYVDVQKYILTYYKYILNLCTTHMSAHMIATNNANKDILCSSKIIFISGKHSFHHSHYLPVCLPPVAAGPNGRNLHGIICLWMILYNNFVGQWNTNLNYQKTTVLKLGKPNKNQPLYVYIYITCIYAVDLRRKPWYVSSGTSKHAPFLWHNFYFTR